MTKSVRRYLLLFCLSVLIICLFVIADSWINHSQQTFARPVLQAQAEDQTAVQQAALQYLDRTSTVPTRIDRTAVSGEFALVSWVQGEAGGTALLKTDGTSWQVVSSGGGLIGVGELVEQGVPQATAERLLDQIDPNWRSYGAP